MRTDSSGTPTPLRTPGITHWHCTEPSWHSPPQTPPQGMQWKGGGGTPPPPPAYPPPKHQVPASMAFVPDSNRPQPLWQPPPTASLTASGAASEVPSPCQTQIKAIPFPPTRLLELCQQNPKNTKTTPCPPPQKKRIPNKSVNFRHNRIPRGEKHADNTPKKSKKGVSRLLFDKGGGGSDPKTWASE